MAFARAYRGIMVGVAVWGALLAFGASWGRDGRHDVRKFLLVFGCTAIYLLFWGAMLAVRRRRMR